MAETSEIWRALLPEDYQERDSRAPLFIFDISGRRLPLVIAFNPGQSVCFGTEVTKHPYSYLENNNNDLVALADILGHSDLNSTRIYTKRRLSDLQEGAERVRFF